MATETGVSLIISTYKSPDFLDKVLMSVSRQTVSPAQVIVTEDGEFEANENLIRSWKAAFGERLEHVRQKDVGNRKPVALNKAIAHSRHPYLIFIDGDCVLRKDFVFSHLELADEQSFLTGRRVELSPKASQILTKEKIASDYLEKFPARLLWDAAFGETDKFSRFFKTPKFLKPIFSRDSVFDIRGCNFSVHRKHMIAINGFSNEFSGAYGEDSDVEYRLKFLGLKMKSVKNAAIQYHLWHKVQVKDDNNQKLLRALLERKEYYASNGLKESAAIV